MPDSQQKGLRSGSDDADSKFATTPVANTTAACHDGVGFVSEGKAESEPEFDVEAEFEDDEVEFEVSSFAEPDDDSDAYLDDPGVDED